ncbi:MAG: hypothetical protein PHY08_12510 [Candidatus Cloacimonetes bacterium]|nr:hypothetical protein [Candidatus Cloacimonadota bacterium]
MNVKKLKIDKYERIMVTNFPRKYDLEIRSVEEKPEVIIYFIDKLSDVNDMILLIKDCILPKDNRVIFVYEKRRKDGVNRDTIYSYFKKELQSEYKLRAPMLCSLSKELSAFVQSYEVVKNNC